eukprot:365413-Chlamydomonas_euryale.AAC.12
MARAGINTHACMHGIFGLACTDSSCMRACMRTKYGMVWLHVKHGILQVHTMHAMHAWQTWNAGSQAWGMDRPPDRRSIHALRGGGAGMRMKRHATHIARGNMRPTLHGATCAQIMQGTMRLTLNGASRAPH